MYFVLFIGFVSLLIKPQGEFHSIPETDTLGSVDHPTFPADRHAHIRSTSRADRTFSTLVHRLIVSDNQNNMACGISIPT
ncbi:hypothetical protein BGY98DRAFT_961106 [Russula aff. rugulosa BPL654]|nr:hypothetical protein BGY98DRAFT_961106 [Russula aff. rugulosa BPL654]